MTPGLVLPDFTEGFFALHEVRQRRGGEDCREESPYPVEGTFAHASSAFNAAAMAGYCSGFASRMLASLPLSASTASAFA